MKGAFWKIILFCLLLTSNLELRTESLSFSSRFQDNNNCFFSAADNNETSSDSFPIEEGEKSKEKEKENETEDDDRNDEELIARVLTSQQVFELPYNIFEIAAEFCLPHIFSSNCKDVLLFIFIHKLNV